MRVVLSSNLPKPLKHAPMARKEWPSGTPNVLRTVESDKSRCSLETGSFAARCSKAAFATPTFPSEFSKSMGFTLWGMALLPTSPAFNFWVKYARDTYCQQSRHKSSMTVFARHSAWQKAANPS